jgi:hypothetical protein
MIYATPLLLSPSAEQRAMGYVKLAYIVPVRQVLRATTQYADYFL